MFSCKNFIVFVELFLYILDSFLMMIDVLVVCSFHSMVSFCRFGFFGVVVRSCGSTAVLCSVWHCGWISGSYDTWSLVLCMFHTVVFCQKGLFLLGSTLLLVVCQWYRWLGVDEDLHMRKIFDFYIVCWTWDVICYCLCWYFQVHVFYDYSTFVLFGEWYGARASWIYFSDVFL